MTVMRLNAMLCVVGVLAGVAMVGCAGGNGRAGDAGGGAVPAEAAELTFEAQRDEVRNLGARQSVRISSGADGDPVEWGALVDAAASADAVLIGEVHGHAMGLSAAAALWEDVLKRAGADAALCLEFFDRDHQLALDDYLGGITDEEAFREHSRRTPGNYPAGHALMVELAREAGAAVIAANAPRRYVGLAREGYGAYDELNPLQAALVEWPGRMPGEAYRERFVDLMTSMGASHGAGEGEDGGEAAREMAESIYRSQVVWDATMSDSVARALEAGHRPAFLVVGRFHVDRRGGTLELLEARAPGARIVTISVVESGPTERPDPEEEGRADYVLHVGEASDG